MERPEQISFPHKTPWLYGKLMLWVALLENSCSLLSPLSLPFSIHFNHMSSLGWFGFLLFLHWGEGVSLFCVLNRNTDHTNSILKLYFRFPKLAQSPAERWDIYQSSQETCPRQESNPQLMWKCWCENLSHQISLDNFTVCTLLASKPHVVKIVELPVEYNSS